MQRHGNTVRVKNKCISLITGYTKKLEKEYSLSEYIPIDIIKLIIEYYFETGFNLNNENQNLFELKQYNNQDPLKVVTKSQSGGTAWGTIIFGNFIDGKSKLTAEFEITERTSVNYQICDYIGFGFVSEKFKVWDSNSWMADDTNAAILYANGYCAQCTEFKSNNKRYAHKLVDNSRIGTDRVVVELDLNQRIGKIYNPKLRNEDPKNVYQVQIAKEIAKVAIVVTMETNFNSKRKTAIKVVKTADRF